tara:strand:+ start:408 stop:638 length:231 start_codon:yes stop_codon:yes gene_type:complete
MSTQMPTLTNEEIKTAEYFSVSEEYAEQVVEFLLDSFDIDALEDYVRRGIRTELIKSKRAFRTACHSYEEVWGEGE